MKPIFYFFENDGILLNLLDIDSIEIRMDTVVGYWDFIVRRRGVAEPEEYYIEAKTKKEALTYLKQITNAIRLQMP